MLSQPIDMAAMKKQEMALQNQKIAFKEINREDLWNMLQDLRHIIVFDVRTKPSEYHIRDSNIISDFVGDKRIVTFSKVFDLYNSKFEMNEAKYKTKRIRRLCIIDDADVKYDEEKNENQKLLMDAVRDYRDFHKVFYLKGGFEEFEKKYPFLCVNFNERDKVQEKQAEKNGEIDEATKKLMYAFSRFPYEIIPDKLYLGSIMNANSTRQCKDLGIKTLIDLIQYEEPVEGIKEKTKDFVYENLPIAENVVDILDLDEICAYLDTLLSKEESRPILIFCKDGEVYSPGLAIAYLMYTKKMKVDLASLSVFQKLSNVNLNPKFYSLLQVYEPKKFIELSQNK